MRAVSIWLCRLSNIWIPRRLIKTSYCKISISLNFYLELTNPSEIWQAPWQHCCRCACQISKRYEHFNTQLTPMRLVIRLLIRYWNGALVAWPWGCNELWFVRWWSHMLPNRYWLLPRQIRWSQDSGGISPWTISGAKTWCNEYLWEYINGLVQERRTGVTSFLH